MDDIFYDVEPEVVIQGAAKIYGVEGFHKYGADILRDDIAIQNNCVVNSRKYGVKNFVYISSSMVYESFKDRTPSKEEFPDLVSPPKTDYGLSKYVGERILSIK